MNSTDRQELDLLRQAMWEIFQRIARTPEHDKEIERFVAFMDRHQEILAGNAE